MFSTKKKLQRDWRFFLIIITLLISIGLVFIYSSSSIYAIEKFNDASYYVKKQVIGVLLGLVGFIFIHFIPFTWLKKSCPYLFFGSLGLTCLTFFSPFAVRIHGSSRWLSLAGFSFQPSELLKIGFVAYCAYFLAQREKKITSLSQTYIPFLLVTGITSIVLLKQPDFGLAITLLITAFLLLFIAKLPFKYIISTVLAVFPFLIMLIVMRPYRLQRIVTFLNPWNDPQGKGFQIIQSLIAIGSGNWNGAGIAHSKQKFFYLPMQHTDFIFSIIAEETGFIGSFVILLLYLMFIYIGFSLASQLTDRFSFFFVSGCTILIALQAFINFAVVTGLAPTKGLGLPFISYGNTAMVCTIWMVGMMGLTIRSALDHQAFEQQTHTL